MKVTARIPQAWIRGPGSGIVVARARHVAGGVVAPATENLGLHSSQLGNIRLSATGRVCAKRWIADRNLVDSAELHQVVRHFQHGTVLLISPEQLPKDIKRAAPDLVASLITNGVEIAFCSHLQIDNEGTPQYASGFLADGIMFININSEQRLLRSGTDFIEPMRTILDS